MTAVDQSVTQKPLIARIDRQSQLADSLLCVGIDPDIERFPRHLREQVGADTDSGEVIVRFASEILDATVDVVNAYKLNLGFFLPFGLPGLDALLRIRRLVPEHIPVILDAKVGDVGNTAEHYARAYFDGWQFDMVTVNPYLGEDSLEPFLQRANRGVLVLSRTSNPGSGDFQDLAMNDSSGVSMPLFERVAVRAAQWDARYPAAVGLVVGATYPRELTNVRRLSPSLPILLPGIGAQGGDLSAAVRAGLDANGCGLLVSASRSVIYAGDGHDFAKPVREAAEQLRAEINAARR